MLTDNPALFYTLLDRTFFESLDRYQPSDEYIALVRFELGAEWGVLPHGVWTLCDPPRHRHLAQGWKIHLSATPVFAANLLRRVLPVLKAARVPFKFCSDPRLVRLTNAKLWPRTGAGKFVTIYPVSDEQFAELCAELHACTGDFDGPYLLTDRPYPGSRVVFYRYGEHLGYGQVSANGQRKPVIRAPDGQFLSDARVPYTREIPWARDPFGISSENAATGDEVLLNDRYRVMRAIRFSSVGGLYIAEDRSSGEEVIVREARPRTGVLPDGRDSREQLAKEARILRRLEVTGLVPRFIDFFCECDHHYLVQEKLRAESFWGYAINIAHLNGDRTADEAFRIISRTVRTLVDGLELIHGCGVVLRDMTRTNVLVTSADEIRFIDFELACELDREDEPHVPGFTIGYASVQQRINERPTVQEDYYALGALILDMLTFSAAGLELNRLGTLASLSLMLADTGLPEVCRDIVVGLTEEDVQRRWTPRVALQRLEGAAPTLRSKRIIQRDLVRSDAEKQGVLRDELVSLIPEMITYIEAQTDYSRNDRLWPASSEVFRTNPISVQYGAAGVGYFLLRVQERLDERILDWIESRLSARPCPPGLYIGVSGAALLLHDAGRRAVAGEWMRTARASHLKYEEPDLYYGAAGWGLANINFWMRTGDQSYLDEACEAGDFLRSTALSDATGSYWSHQNGVALGLAHGQAGVALFLTYLSAATSSAEWLELADSAFQFDWARRQELNGSLLWFSTPDAPRSGPKSPHMRFGTAGIGSAALRLFAATHDDDYRSRSAHCARSVGLRLSNKLWHDYGMAGYGECLLDAYHFLGDQDYLATAYAIAEGILPHRIRTTSGVAFPGSELIRISCDFGQGGAGIGLFVYRLLNPKSERTLFPDALLNAARREGKHRALPTVDVQRGEPVAIT